MSNKAYLSAILLVQLLTLAHVANTTTYAVLVLLAAIVVGIKTIIEVIKSN